MTQAKLTLIADQAVIAMKRAVIKVMQEHKQLGLPLSVWKNGKIVRIPASKIKIPRMPRNLKTRKIA